MSGDIAEGRFSQLPRTLAKLAKTGSVQNAKQSLFQNSKSLLSLLHIIEIKYT